MRTAMAVAAIFLSTALFAADRAAPPDLSKQGFEHFKTLAGEWVGTSTKGWQEQIRFNVIANGSAVEERSFDAHPGETMLTIVHLDGERLMLTHYCAAKNQPRLLATKISPDGKTYEFTFLDATNLPSRDKGHMDKAVYRFVDADHFTTQWTWYQDGKEKWLEEIEMVRISKAETAAK
jgi:hypothetical protein